MRAPLNSRVVSGAGHRDKGKGKAKESSLYGVPVEIQEALVLEDLLFVLMVCLLFRLVARPPLGDVFRLAVICEHDARSCRRLRGEVLVGSAG